MTLQLLTPWHFCSSGLNVFLNIKEGIFILLERVMQVKSLLLYFYSFPKGVLC